MKSIDLLGGDFLVNGSQMYFPTQTSILEVLWHLLKILFSYLTIILDFLYYLLTQDYGWLITTCFGCLILHLLAVNFIFRGFERTQKSRNKFINQLWGLLPKIVIGLVKLLSKRVWLTLQFLWGMGKFARLKLKIKIALERFFSRFQKGH